MKSFGASLVFVLAFAVACIVAAVAIGELGAYVGFGVPALGALVLAGLGTAARLRAKNDGDS